jgi:hypothetical protein
VPAVFRVVDFVVGSRAAEEFPIEDSLEARAIDYCVVELLFSWDIDIIEVLDLIEN